jgi:hypothetical protein
MPQFRFQLRLRTLFGLVALTCLACGYAMAYLYALEPRIYLTESAGGIGVGYREADYRGQSNLTHWLFAPAYLVDRTIRPEYWTDYCTLDDDRI